MAALDSTSITAGESVRVALRVENVGGQDGTFQAALTVDSRTVDSMSVPVEAGRTETVVFERRFDEPGEYEVAVADSSLGTLTVTAASDGGTVTPRASDDTDGTGTRAIQVTDVAVPSDWVKEGYEATVRATVVNTADWTANRTLTVTVDDQPVATETVTLRPSERDGVVIEFEAVGGTVEVEGIDAGRISVGDGDDGAGARVDTAVEGPGLGFELGIAVLVVAVVGLVSVAALWRER